MSSYIEFSDPRLVALYDTLNPFARDTEFSLSLAEDSGVLDIVDIGCGTGLLACEYARRGHRVTGVEPEPAMLHMARARRYGDRVAWVEGTAESLDSDSYDLAVMTGHTAQVFLERADWDSTLEAVHRSLRTGGRLVFESRNPVTEPWKKWTESARREVEHLALGRVSVWPTFVDIADGRVRYEMHYVFADSGEEIISLNSLAFRTREEIESSLVGA